MKGIFWELFSVLSLKSTLLRYDLGSIFLKLLSSFLGGRHLDENSTREAGTEFFYFHLKFSQHIIYKTSTPQMSGFQKWILIQRIGKKKPSRGQKQMLKDKADVPLRHFLTSQLQGAARASLQGLATLPTCSTCLATLALHTPCAWHILGSQRLLLNGYEIKMAVLMTALPRQMCQPPTSDRVVYLGRMLLEARESETGKQGTYHRVPPTPLPLPSPCQRGRRVRKLFTASGEPMS